MMNREWIESHLSDYLVIEGNDTIIKVSDNTTTSVDDFLTLFGGVEPTLQALLERDSDGGHKKGYEALFREWHTKGILPA